MTNIFYVDGEFVAQDDAVVPVTDLSVLRGYGVFDFMRTYGGHPFMLDAHIARLRRSAELIDMPVMWTDAELKAIVLATVARNPIDEANVRIVVTGGESPNYLIPDDKPRLIVMVTPSIKNPDHLYADGASAITVPMSRSDPLAKTINYIGAIRAMKRARAAGAAEALYMDHAGHVLEGTTTNIFAVFGDVIVTPQDGILPGITRGVVLDLLDGVYRVEKRALPLSELLRADEAFITASNKQVMPIVRVDDHLIAAGTVGAHTRAIMARYREFAYGLAWVNNGQG